MRRSSVRVRLLAPKFDRFFFGKGGFFCTFSTYKIFCLIVMVFIWCLSPAFRCLQKQKQGCIPRVTRAGAPSFYYACFLTGCRISCSVSAAAASADWIACAYILLVVVVFAWPSRFATVCRLVPAAISKVAFVCRSPCSVMGGRSFRWMKSWNQPDKVSGWMGWPSHVVNNRPHSCH